MNRNQPKPYRCEAHVSWDGKSCSECGASLKPYRKLAKAIIAGECGFEETI